MEWPVLPAAAGLAEDTHTARPLPELSWSRSRSGEVGDDDVAAGCDALVIRVLDMSYGPVVDEPDGVKAAPDTG